MIWRFEQRGRRWGVVLPLLAAWTVIAVIWLAFDAAGWIVGVLFALTLPALWDIYADSRAWVEVWPGRIVWRGALSRGDVADIDHVRLDRRFNGAMRITILRRGGAQLRLPPDLGVPSGAFEAALGDAGIPVQRHPFAIF